METSDWTVVIEFDDLAVQAERDPEYTFPNDECSRVIEYVRAEWCLLPEDLQAIAEWTPTKLTLQLEMFDQMEDVTRVLWAHAMPKSISVRRNK